MKHLLLRMKHLLQVTLLYHYIFATEFQNKY